MNKKGSTLTNWVFVIVTVLLFLAILQASILSPMNTIYNKTYTTGLDTSGLDDFEKLKKNSNTEVEGSEVESTSEGFNFLSGWKIGKGVYSTIVGFIGGNFIHSLVVGVLEMPKVVADIIIILIWINLVLIILGIFFKWWV